MPSSIVTCSCGHSMRFDFVLSDEQRSRVESGPCVSCTHPMDFPPVHEAATHLWPPFHKWRTATYTVRDSYGPGEDYVYTVNSAAGASDPFHYLVDVYADWCHGVGRWQ